MTLRVSGKNMDVGDALRTRAEGHFDGVVKKYFDGGYTGHLTLEPEGSGFNALCLVHLDSGTILQATAYGGDAISAYEILTETIEKRLRRYNRKLKQHRHHTQRRRRRYGAVLCAGFARSMTTSWPMIIPRR